MYGVPVYVPSPSRSRGQSAPPSQAALISTGWFICGLLLFSAIVRSLVRWRRDRGPAALYEIAAMNRRAFMPIELVPRNPEDARVIVARWDDAAGVYRTLAVRARTAEGQEVRLHAGVPLQNAEGALVRVDENGEELFATPGERVWLLARVARVREPEGPAFRGQAADAPAPSIEPILERFVLVADRNGPWAKPTSKPSFGWLLAYPGVPIAIALAIAHRVDNLSSVQAIGWTIYGPCGVVELVAWSLHFVPEGKRL